MVPYKIWLGAAFISLPRGSFQDSRLLHRGEQGHYRKRMPEGHFTLSQKFLYFNLKSNIPITSATRYSLETMTRSSPHIKGGEGLTRSEYQQGDYQEPFLEAKQPSTIALPCTVVAGARKIMQRCLQALPN